MKSSLKEQIKTAWNNRLKQDNGSLTLSLQEFEQINWKQFFDLFVMGNLTLQKAQMEELSNGDMYVTGSGKISDADFEKIEVFLVFQTTRIEVEIYAESSQLSIEWVCEKAKLKFPVLLKTLQKNPTLGKIQFTSEEKIISFEYEWPKLQFTLAESFPITISAPTFKCVLIGSDHKKIGLLANIHFLGSENSLIIVIPYSEHDKWELHLAKETNGDFNLENTLPQLEQHIPGSRLTDLFPTSIFQKFPRVQIEDFHLVFPYNFTAPEQFDIVIRAENDFPLVGEIKLKQPTLSIHAVSLQNQLTANLSFEGMVSLGTHSNLYFTADVFSDLETPWDFSVEAEIDLKRLSQLEKLPLGFNLNELRLPTGMLRLHTITLQRFDFSINPKNWALETAEFDIHADCEVELIKGIKFVQPALTINYDSETSSIKEAIDGEFSGELIIGRTSFFGRASKAGNDWTLIGFTGIKNPVDLAEFLKDLAEIGDAKIDFKSFPEIKISDSRIEFQTKNSALSFTTTLHTTIPLPFVPDAKLQTASFIDLHGKKENNTYTFIWNFISELKIGAALFSVHFQKEEEGKRVFEAGWKAVDTTESIGLQKIAEAFGIAINLKELPEILKPQLQEVAFSYNESSKTLSLAAYATNNTQFYLIAKKDDKDKWLPVIGLDYAVQEQQAPEDVDPELYKAAKETKLQRLSLLYAATDLTNFELPTAPALPSGSMGKLSVTGKKITTTAGLFFAAEIKDIQLPAIQQVSGNVDQFYLEVAKTAKGVKAQVKGQLSITLPKKPALTMQVTAAYNSAQKELDFQGEVESTIGLWPFAEAILPKEFALPEGLELPDIKKIQLSFNTSKKTYSFQLQTLETKRQLSIPGLLTTGCNRISIGNDGTTFKLEAKAVTAQLHALNGIFPQGIGGNLTISVSSTKKELLFEPSSFQITTLPIKYNVTETVSSTGQTTSKVKQLQATLIPGKLLIERDGKNWSAEASAKLSVKDMPQPVHVLFENERNGVFTPKQFEGTFKIDQHGASATISGDPLIELEIPDLLEKIDAQSDLPRFGKSGICIQSISCRIGKVMEIDIDTGIALPEHLNTILGFKSNVLRTYKKGELKSYIKSKLTLGSEKISGGITGSPFIDNEFIVVGEEQITIDFDKLFEGDSLGRITFKKPKLSLNAKSGSFQFSGGYVLDKEKGLKIPSYPLQQLLKAMNLEALGKTLPKSIPVKSVKATQVVEDLKSILRQPEINCPQAFLDVLDGINNGLEKLPKRFRDYLSISIPDELDFSIDMTADGGVSFNVSTKGDPIQLLLPTPPQLIGIRLKGLSFGTALGGSLLKLEVSAELDVFDPITLAASYLLLDEPGLKPYLATREEICQTIVVDEFVVLIIYATQIPIPLPLFYKELGIRFVSFDGTGITTKIALPKPEFNAMKLLKIVTGIKRFVLDNTDFEVEYPITFKETTVDNDMNLKFFAGPFYLQLPKYLSKEEDQSYKRIGITRTYQLFDALNTTGILLNGFKKLIFDGSPAYLIKAFPIEYRYGELSANLLGKLKFSYKWLLSTPHELIQLAEKDPGFFADLNASRNLLRNLQRNAYIEVEKSDKIPKITGLQDTDNGLVTFMRGNMTIKDVAAFNIEGGLAWDGKAFGVCYTINGTITPIKLDMLLQGMVVIRKDSFAIEGKSTLMLFGIKLFDGSYKFSERYFFIEAKSLPSGANGPIAFNGKLEGQFSNTKIDLSGRINLRFLAFSLEGSAKLLVNESTNSESYFELIGKVGLEKIFSTDVIFKTHLVGGQTISNLNIDTYVLGILHLHLNGLASIVKNDVLVKSEMKVSFLGAEIAKAKLELTNEKLVLNTTFNFIPGILEIKASATLKSNDFLLNGDGILHLGPFKSTTNILINTTAEKKLFNLDVSNVLGSGATANFKLHNAESKLLELSCDMDKSISLLNGMLRIYAENSDTKGPSAQLTLKEKAVERFYFGGGTNFLGIKSTGYLQFNAGVYSYQLKKIWDSGVFSGQMIFNGVFEENKLKVETSVLMSLNIGKVFKQILSVLPETNSTIEVNIRKLQVHIEKNLTPEDIRNKELQEQRERLQKLLNDAKEEARIVTREVEKQQKRLDALLETINSTSGLDSGISQKYRTTITTQKAGFTNAHNDYNRVVTELPTYITGQSNMTAELHKIDRIAPLLEQLDQLGYVWKTEIGDYWNDQQGKASPRYTQWNNLISELKNAVSILDSSINYFIREPRCRQKFEAMSISPDNYRTDYKMDQLITKIEDYQHNTFWRHFLFNRFSNRSNHHSIANAIKNDLLTQVNKRRDFIVLYLNCLNEHKTALEKDRDLALRQLENLEGKANGLILLVLADIKAINDGLIYQKEVQYYPANLQEQENALSTGSTESTYGLAIDIEISFKIGNLEFNLVNLNWKDQLNSWGDGNLMDKLPGMITEYLVRNFFKILTQSLGSITKATEFLWNFVHQVIQSNPEFSSQSMPEIEALSAEALKNHADFEANDIPIHLATQSMVDMMPK